VNLARHQKSTAVLVAKEESDACKMRRQQCQCLPKRHCPRCANYLANRKGKCECEKLPPRCTSDDCCARRLLSVQPDFKAQKGELEESLEKSGLHRVMFYPKFHCELNHIERLWCHGKKYARENCDYTLDGLWRNVIAGPPLTFTRLR